MILKLLQGTNRIWGEGSTCDWTVWHWFVKFHSEDMSFEDQGGRGCSSATDNRHLKSLVKQNSYPSVKEVSQIMGVSISTISHYLMKIGLMEKLDKWVPHESWS